MSTFEHRRCAAAAAVWWAALVSLALHAGCGDEGSASLPPNDAAPLADAAPGCLDCAGCCIGGECHPGDELLACGLGGVGCQVCSFGEQCVTGRCQPQQMQCSSATCPGGCCDSTGACRLDFSPGLCGTAGVACAPCQPGRVCQAGRCVDGSPVP